MTVASEQLWETFNVPLQHFIWRRVPDPHSAEDILQDVFLKIHARIDTLHQQNRVAAWIYQIARNAIADYYRAQRPTFDVPETLAAPDDVVDDNVVQELLPCVAAMVDALPDAYREALRLREYEGLSQRELSEQLGISFSGAKSRVQRAREDLDGQCLGDDAAAAGVGRPCAPLRVRAERACEVRVRMRQLRAEVRPRSPRADRSVEEVDQRDRPPDVVVDREPGPDCDCSVHKKFGARIFGFIARVCVHPTPSIVAVLGLGGSVRYV
jgi:RNA polymerase sigma-70 factor (ECF subfamily)